MTVRTDIDLFVQADEEPERSHQDLPDQSEGDFDAGSDDESTVDYEDEDDNNTAAPSSPPTVITCRICLDSPSVGLVINGVFRPNKCCAPACQNAQCMFRMHTKCAEKWIKTSVADGNESTCPGCREGYDRKCLKADAIYVHAFAVEANKQNKQADQAQSSLDNLDAFVFENDSDKQALQQQLESQVEECRNMAKGYRALDEMEQLLKPEDIEASQTEEERQQTADRIQEYYNMAHSLLPNRQMQCVIKPTYFRNCDTALSTVMDWIHKQKRYIYIAVDEAEIGHYPTRDHIAGGSFTPTATRGSNYTDQSAIIKLLHPSDIKLPDSKPMLDSIINGDSTHSLPGVVLCAGYVYELKAQAEVIDEVNRDRDAWQTAAKWDTLTEEQQMGMEFVLHGRNVFFTGAGGTGKTSVTLPAVVSVFTAKKIHFAVVASTGCGAGEANKILQQIPDCEDVVATTFHAFVGAGLAEGSVEKLWTKHKKHFQTLFKKVDGFILDEVSMVDLTFMHKVNEWAKRARGCDEFMGGIQLIVTGDFCQLLPSSGSVFLFSELWMEANFASIILTTIFRTDNPEFIEIQNAIRLGLHTHEHVQRLLEIVGKLNNGDDVVFGGMKDALQKLPDEEILRLMGTRREVATANTKVTQQLRPRENSKLFELKETVERDPRASLHMSEETMKKGEFQARMKLVSSVHGLHRPQHGPVLLSEQLTEGDTIAFRVNKYFPDNQCIMKHSKGKLIRIDRDRLTIKMFGESVTREVMKNAEFSQDIIGDADMVAGKLILTGLPIYHADADTVHRAQGQSVRGGIIDCSNINKDAAFYVAISRMRFAELTALIAFKAACIKTNKDIARWYIEQLELQKQFMATNKSSAWTTVDTISTWHDVQLTDPSFKIKTNGVSQKKVTAEKYAEGMLEYETILKDAPPGCPFMHVLVDSEPSKCEACPKCKKAKRKWTDHNKTCRATQNKKPKKQCNAPLQWWGSEPLNGREVTNDIPVHFVVNDGGSHRDKQCSDYQFVNSSQILAQKDEEDDKVDKRGGAAYRLVFKERVVLKDDDVKNEKMFCSPDTVFEGCLTREWLKEKETSTGSTSSASASPENVSHTSEDIQLSLVDQPPFTPVTSRKPSAQQKKKKTPGELYQKGDFPLDQIGYSIASAFRRSKPGKYITVHGFGEYNLRISGCCTGVRACTTDGCKCVLPGGSRLTTCTEDHRHVGELKSVKCNAVLHIWMNTDSGKFLMMQKGHHSHARTPRPTLSLKSLSRLATAAQEQPDILDPRSNAAFKIKAGKIRLPGTGGFIPGVFDNVFQNLPVVRKALHQLRARLRDNATQGDTFTVLSRIQSEESLPLCDLDETQEGYHHGIGYQYIRSIHKLANDKIGYVHLQAEWAAVLLATKRKFSHLQIDVQYKPCIGNTYNFEIGAFDTNLGLNVTLARILFNADYYSENQVITLQ